MAVGVEKRLSVLHDPDMSPPEYKVAAAQIVTCRFRAESSLHVGIARGSTTNHHQRQLHQSRTINPEARAPAPKIGRFEKARRHLDVIIRGPLPYCTAVPGDKSTPIAKQGVAC